MLINAVDLIIHNNSIVTYLEQRGHHPHRTLSDGRLQYLCPFPDHQETKPSFMVWTKGEYENFYCFGCQRHHHIIHLVSGLENISIPEAIKKLYNGDIDITDVSLIDRYNNVLNSNINKEMQDISLLLMEISMKCDKFLNSHHDSESINFIDKIYNTVDVAIMEYDFDRLLKINKNLMPLLRKRSEHTHGSKR